MKLSILLFLLLPSGARAQTLANLFDTDRFHAAFFDPATGKFTFRPFQEIDWEAHARRALPWLNLDHPAPAQIARLSSNEGGGPQFRYAQFPAPLAPAVRRASYLLIHDTGIVPLEPVGLEGTVSFDFDAALASVTHRSFSGTVVGRPSRPASSAAFAITGRPSDVQDVVAPAGFERRTQSGSASYLFHDGRRTLSWTPAEGCAGPSAVRNCWEPASAVAFRLAGRRMLLVRWKETFCLSSYTLFLADGVLQPVAGNGYACDI